jgi:hypothetical protein
MAAAAVRQQSPSPVELPRVIVYMENCGTIKKMLLKRYRNLILWPHHKRFWCLALKSYANDRSTAINVRRYDVTLTMMMESAIHVLSCCDHLSTLGSDSTCCLVHQGSTADISCREHAKHIADNVVLTQIMAAQAMASQIRTMFARLGIPWASSRPKEVRHSEA